MGEPTICKAYVREYPHEIWPDMFQYLHFRIPDFPLNRCGTLPIDRWIVHFRCLLVICDSLLWKMAIKDSQFSHWKWWFSIVMLVYQRVSEIVILYIYVSLPHGTFKPNHWWWMKKTNVIIVFSFRIIPVKLDKYRLVPVDIIDIYIYILISITCLHLRLHLLLVIDEENMRDY